MGARKRDVARLVREANLGLIDAATALALLAGLAGGRARESAHALADLVGADRKLVQPSRFISRLAAFPDGGLEPDHDEGGRPFPPDVPRSPRPARRTRPRRRRPARLRQARPPSRPA